MIQRITIENHLKKLVLPKAEQKNDEYKLEFSGFSPVRTAQKYISNILQHIYQLAPSSSFLKMYVRKGKKGFYGFVKISSDTKEFFVEATGDKLTHMAAKLSEGIDKQLSIWRANRFLPDEI